MTLGPLFDEIAAEHAELIEQVRAAMAVLGHDALPAGAEPSSSMALGTLVGWLVRSDLP